jgi:hypothetical protein
MMSELILANWEYILIGFYALEKIVKLSPTQYDDILFDAVIKPIFNKLPFGKK